MALALIFSFLLTAWGVESLANTSDKTNPYLQAVITSASEGAVENFTAELLPDGLVLLKWPLDPLAISYLILSNGKLTASVPASVLSALVQAKGKSAANGKFSIESVDASNMRSEWVSNPVIAVDEALPEEETPLVEETPPIEEVPPVEQVPPVEMVNLPPDITDTSYNCDPVIESVAFTVGQTDHFTLSVTDESPLTLTYSFNSSKEGVVNVEVDGNGVFTISALQVGDTYLWLSAEDEKGLVDEFELRVVVQ